MENPSIIQCPVCNKRFPQSTINIHVNTCLGEPEEVTVIDVQPSKSTNKRKSDPTNGDSWSFMMTGKSRVKRLKHDTDTVVIDDSSDENRQLITNRTNGGKALQTLSSSKRKEDETHSHKPQELDQASTKITESKRSTTLGATLDSNKSVVNLEDLSMPLAEFMRPCTLDMYIGQEKAVGSNSILGSLLHSKYLPSLIFWGPPGCGKTTLAKIVSKKWKDKAMFKKLSAVNSGVKDVGEVVKQAKNDQKMFHKSTILFLDEIHRFNKTQQDSLLPHVEDGTITLIGATTENPSFQVNNALLSRCKVIVLEKLDCEAICKILINATEKLGYHTFENEDEILASNKNQTGHQDVWVDKSALELLSQVCDGDARIALNGLQMAVQSQMANCSQSKSMSQGRKVTVSQNASPEETGPLVVKSEEVKQCLQKSHIVYDKSDDHYNMLSAFHKSIRGCADSAALYWLARMLEGGESPSVVARRMVACATEDIGLADPQALVMSISAFQAVQFLGMPECEKALAECAVYLARAPKSVEVFLGYTKAKACIWEHKGPLPSVPVHLRNASNKFLKNMGYGKGYDYKSRDQEFLPECLKGTNFFEDTSEAELKRQFINSTKKHT